MNASPQPPVYFFVHVPKCAGRTIELHLEKHTAPGTFIYVRRYKAPKRYLAANRFHLPDNFRAERVRAMSSHHLGVSLADRFPGREIRQSVLLRDPVGMLVSFYNFRMSSFDRQGWPHVSFRQFCRSRHLNPTATFLLSNYLEVPWSRIVRMSDAAKFDLIGEKLEKFWFVGDYRRCDEIVALVSRDLGIPEVADRANVLEQKVLEARDLAPAERDELLERNALDLRLYETWKDRGFGEGQPVAAAVPLSGGQGRTVAHELGRLVEITRLDMRHKRMGRRVPNKRKF